MVERRTLGASACSAVTAWIAVAAMSGLGLARPILAAVASPEKPSLANKLSALRERVNAVEQGLLNSMQVSREAKANLSKIQLLLKVQNEERELGRSRIKEIESTISELELRRGLLREKVAIRQKSMRRFLVEINRSMHEEPHTLDFLETERLEAPRRKVLRNLVDHGLREVEELKADLGDADHLENMIQEERNQLAYLVQDLEEQASILALNRQLQLDMLKRHVGERVGQLDNYRKLKTAETQVEHMIQNFNAHKELEQSMEAERVANQAMRQGTFAKLKGRLPLPIGGKILTSFGPSFDPKSSLKIFKKGVDIEAARLTPVLAISSGKIAFSGELPNYGRVAIIDHGDHFYSLCAHLGELKKQAGESVAAGDVIGTTDENGAPLYFEIRSRNIAVNPLQWVSN